MATDGLALESALAEADGEVRSEVSVGWTGSGPVHATKRAEQTSNAGKRFIPQRYCALVMYKNGRSGFYLNMARCFDVFFLYFCWSCSFLAVFANTLT